MDWLHDGSCGTLIGYLYVLCVHVCVCAYVFVYVGMPTCVYLHLNYGVFFRMKCGLNWRR